MKEQFRITVADSVDTDEIWVELRSNGKLLLEIKPLQTGTQVSLCCEGSWIDLDLTDFMEALNASIKRASQLADITTEEAL